jgi:hypothetical protein
MLVEHLAVFVIRGVIDTQDKLYASYLAGSTPALREPILAFVGRALAEDGDIEPLVVERAQALWVERLEAVSDEPESDPKELEAFGWWTRSSKLDADWRAAQIVTALRLTGGRIDLGHSVLEELAVLAATYPAQSVEAARRIVEADREGREVVGAPDALRKIIESAIDFDSEEELGGCATTRPPARREGPPRLQGLGVWYLSTHLFAPSASGRATVPFACPKWLESAGSRWTRVEPIPR